MSTLGNIFLDSLNTIFNQTNYLRNVSIYQNTRLIMANNPEYGISNTKIYIKPIICDQSICGNDDRVEK
jgi:hypothetical protein